MPWGSKIRMTRMVTPKMTGTSSFIPPNTCGTRMTKAAPMMEPPMEASPPMMTATKMVIDSMKVKRFGSR